MAHCPNKCTGIIAFVLGVIALLILSILIVKSFLSTSTKIALSPNNFTTSAVATKVKSGQIISSPLFNSNAMSATCKASVPLAHGITCFIPKYSSNSFWKACTLGPLIYAELLKTSFMEWSISACIFLY